MSDYKKFSKILWSLWSLSFLLLLGVSITAFTIPNVKTDLDSVKTYSSLLYCHSVSLIVGLICWVLLLILNNSKGRTNVLLSGFFGFVLSILSGSSLSYYSKKYQIPMM
jgi:hypothetical protein